jgi:hypothetical protein
MGQLYLSVRSSASILPLGSRYRHTAAFRRNTLKHKHFHVVCVENTAPRLFPEVYRMLQASESDLLRTILGSTKKLSEQFWTLYNEELCDIHGSPCIFRIVATMVCARGRDEKDKECVGHRETSWKQLLIRPRRR